MKYAQLVFSPTGGTQKAAEAITRAWSSDVDTIDLTDVTADFSKCSFHEDDLVLIAIPSYGGRVPGIAAQRLSQIHGNGARCVLTCVYGNRAYEDTLVEMQDIAERCGFRVLAAVAAVAEHSIMHQYAAGRPDSQDVKRLHDLSEKILEKFRSGNQSIPALPGSRPYKKGGGVGLIPQAGGACTECGLCAQQCPTGAIDKDNIRKADGKKCISCMRCVARCPHSARKVNGVLVSVAALAIKKACSEKKTCELFI